MAIKLGEQLGDFVRTEEGFVDGFVPGLVGIGTGAWLEASGVPYLPTFFYALGGIALLGAKVHGAFARHSMQNEPPHGPPY